MKRLLLLLSMLPLAGGCNGKGSPQQAEKPRTLAEAREIALALFRELDSFKLEKQTEVGLGGQAAVRMEASWNHGGQVRRGIIYVVDQPRLYNVIYYTAPSENSLFEAGYPEFQKVIREMKMVPYDGKLAVVQEGDVKIMQSPDLQLAIRYPASWVYGLDEVNRAVVFSGPRDSSTWLTTINFSVIQKWGDKP